MPNTKKLTHICRICLELIPENPINMNTHSISEGILVLDVVSYCLKELDLNLAVQRTICKDCLKDVEVFYNLKCQVAKTETTILNYFKANQIDPTDKIDLNYLKEEHQLRQIVESIDVTYESIASIFENQNKSNAENVSTPMEISNEIINNNNETVNESLNASVINNKSNNVIMKDTSDASVINNSLNNSVMAKNTSNTSTADVVIELLDSDSDTNIPDSSSKKEETKEENEPSKTDKTDVKKKEKTKVKKKRQPFCCSVCNKTFSDTFLVKYHINMKHKDQTNAPYKCRYCPFTSLLEEPTKDHFFQSHYQELKEKKKLLKKKKQKKKLIATGVIPDPLNEDIPNPSKEEKKLNTVEKDVIIPHPIKVEKDIIPIPIKVEKEMIAIETEVIPNPLKAEPNLTNIAKFHEPVSEANSSNTSLCDELNNMFGDIV